MGRPPKYTAKRVKQICDLISKDNPSIEKICKIVGISDTAYYDWQKDKLEFSEVIKKAKDKFYSNLVEKATNSLNKLVEGYEYEETKTVYITDRDGKPKIKEQTKIKKHIPPNLGAIIHVQTNKDPENWKNRQTSEITGKDGKDLIPKPRALSPAELKEYMKELENEF